MAEKRSAFDSMSPAQTFFGGIILGFLVLCTIGFFIFLSVFLKGGMELGASKGSGNVAAAPTAAAPAAPTPAAPSAPVVVAEVTDADHVRGNVDAPITIVEYSDFECPFCARFQDTVEQVLAAYPDQVRLVYRHFPLSFHPEAGPAGEASECAADQGKFWEFHDELFANTSNLSANLYRDIATDLGLNLGDFNDCVSSGKYAAAVSEDQASGLAAGVGGTPHSIIIAPDGSTTPISGALPFAQVQPVIDGLLN